MTYTVQIFCALRGRIHLSDGSLQLNPIIFPNALS